MMTIPHTTSGQREFSSGTTDSSITYHSFTVPRGLTYHYIHIAPTPEATKPYILLLHGFPSHPHDFHHQIDHLTTHHGFGIIAPVLLGYRPSSAPLDPTLYRLKFLCDDLIALLDHLNINNKNNTDTALHAIGHDWGATLLSRLDFYHPDRLSKLAYLTIAPSPFGRAGKFDLAAVNALTEQRLGYAAFGYQGFFVRDPSAAAALMTQQHERMEMLMLADDNSTELWREYFGRVGGLETWLKFGREMEDDENNDSGPEVRILDAVTERDLAVRRRVFGEMEETAMTAAAAAADGAVEGTHVVSGYAGPLMYYLALNRNLNVDDEEERLAELRKTRDLKEVSQDSQYQTDKQVLQVVCDKDPIALPQIHAGMAKAYVKDPDRQLKIESLHSGHFIMYEQPEKLNAILEEFFA